MPEIFNSTSITILALLMIIIVAVMLLRGNKFNDLYRKKRLMTDHEMVLYRKLNTLLSHTKYNVLSQVAMSAIVTTTNGLSKSEHRAARNRFDRKIIDFVIINEYGQAILIIELDDSSHSASKDSYRDSITSAAGYATERLRRANTIKIEDLKFILSKHI